MIFQRAIALSSAKVSKLLDIVRSKFKESEKLFHESAKTSFTQDFWRIFGDLSRIHKHWNHMGVFTGNEYMEQTLQAIEQFIELNEKYNFEFNWAGYFWIFQRAFTMYLKNSDERVWKIIDFMISFNFRINKDHLKVEYFINLEKVLLYFNNIQNSHLKDKISDIVSRDKKVEETQCKYHLLIFSI